MHLGGGASRMYLVTVEGDGMAELVNLRLARKRATKRQDELRAESNRLAHGQSKHRRKFRGRAKGKSQPRSRPAPDRSWRRPMKSPVVKRSIVIAGHKTSVSLEDAFWTSLKEIAGHRNMTLSDMVASIDTGRHAGNLSSAIRLFVLDHYRAQLNGGAARETADKRVASILRAD
jgi:predicted DNA-binding ribbon-helix-helix protein